MKNSAALNRSPERPTGTSDARAASTFKAALVFPLAPGNDNLIVGHRQKGREVLSVIGLACTCRGYNKGETLLVDGSRCLGNQVRLKRLWRATGACVFCGDPWRKAGCFDHRAGHRLLWRDGPDERPQDRRGFLRPIPAHRPIAFSSLAPCCGKVW